MTYQFAVIAPSSTEYRAVRKRMKEIKDVSDNPIATEGQLGKYRILCVQSGEGQQIAATDTHQVLKTWDPRYIILVGIAGGIPKGGKAAGPRIRRGDIVLAKYAYCYDYGNLRENGFVGRRNYDATPDSNLLTQASDLAIETSWKERIGRKPPLDRKNGKSRVHHVAVHTVNVGSGNMVVDGPRRVLRRYDIPEDMRAVEMECAGVAQAIRTYTSGRNSQVGFLMIRSISDFIGDLAAVRRRWKPYASAVAAAFLEGFLENVTIVPADEWQRFIDRMLDKSFESINRQFRGTRRSIPKILNDTFGITLTVAPGRKPVPRPPEGLEPDDIDPNVVLEANTGGEDALSSRMLASKEDLRWLKYYVRPHNYVDLIERLTAERLLILTGEPGVGKTMTALSIVNDFFKRGITPRQGPIRSERMWSGTITTERTDILFLDDPFGRDRSLDREILESRKRALLTHLREGNEDKGYILITTRSDKYDDFINVAGSGNQRDFNGVAIEIRAAGYDLEARKRLVESYSHEGVFRCKWASRPQASEIITTAAKKVASPLNIKHFCYGTRMANHVEEKTIRKYARTPLNARLGELKDCPWGDYLFLAFSTFLQSTATDRGKLSKLYKRLSSKIAEKKSRTPDPWDLRMEAKYDLWFRWHDSGWCHVVHSTVGNALDTFFRDNRAIREIIELIFVSLCEMKDQDARLAAAIGLPRALPYFRGAAGLIEALVEKDEDQKVRQALGQSLARNVSQEDLPLIESAIRKLFVDSKVNGPEVLASVACAVLDNSVSLGDQLAKEAARFAGRKDLVEVRRQVSWALASNYRYLPAAARDELKKLVSKDEANEWVKISAGEAIADNFEQDDELVSLLLDLVADPSDFVRRSIVGALEYNLDGLPDRLRLELFGLSKGNQLAVVEWLVWVAMEHFDELAEQEDFREWFVSLAGHDNPRVRKWFAEALVRNFDKLDDNYLALLTTLTEDRNEMVRTAACAFPI